MKKTFCALLALLVLTISVAAAPPFAEVSEPENGIFVHSKGEGYDKIAFVFTRADDLLKYAGFSLEQLQEAGASEITQYVQFDFSTDSTINFSYTPDWDKSELSGNGAELPGDNLLARVPALDLEKVEDQKLIEGILGIDGPLSSAAGFAQFNINFTQHTLYAHARLCIAYTDAQGESGLMFSPWTEPQLIVSEGLSSPVTPSALEAPQLENGSLMTAYSGESYLEFSAVLSPLDRQAAVWGTASFNTPLELELQMRYSPDGEWAAAIGDAKTATEVGARTVAVAEGKEYIELQGRYIMRDADGAAAYTSAWSKSLVIGEQATKPGEQTTPVCPVCGNCTTPGGMCVWIWGGLLLVSVVVFTLLIILLLHLRKKAAADK